MEAMVVTATDGVAGEVGPVMAGAVGEAGMVPGVAGAPVELEAGVVVDGEATAAGAGGEGEMLQSPTLYV